MNCPKDGRPCRSLRDPITVGVMCPSCGTVELRVLETSHAADGIYRLRACLVCGRRLQTVELLLNVAPRGRGRIRGRYPPIPKGNGGK